ncbi:MAG: serine protease [Maribacter sp.]|jgi:serine protease
MQLKSTILVVLATLFISISSYAQTVHPDYQDGKIYLKIKDNSDFIFRSMDEVQANKRFRDLYYIFNQYQVTKSGRPFLVLNTPIFERTYKLEFQDPSQVYNLIKELERVDFVEYAERVELLRISLTPNDPAIAQNQAYHLNNIQAFDAWDIHTGGNAVVAIVDDAVRINHVDLAPNAWVNTGEIPNNGQDDDGNGYVDDINGFDVADNDNNPNPPASATDFNFSHGTHCAGIACGATNNGTGIASIGFNNKIMAVKCTSDGGNAQFVENGYEGVAYAMASGADVISMSWGGGGSSNSAQNVFTQAHSLGITLVAAAGNDNVSTVFYPAGYNFVISVASSNQNDQKSSFSNFGSWIDITAPGSDIISTVASSSSSYQSYDGTSMACPMVAGLCGLLKSFDGSLSPDEIEGCLTNGADNIDQENPSYLSQLGAGRINAFNTLQCSTPENPPNANFIADKQGDLCLGETVQFTDVSSYSPTSWNWTFPGGTPGSSNAQNPSVTYNTIGNYNVTLTVTNQFGNDSQTFNGYISIGIDGREEFFLADFEDQGAGWAVDNADGNTTWIIWEVGGTNGGASAAGIDNYNYNAVGERDALISPILDFGGRTNVILDYDYAHRRYSQNEADSLVIYISSNGGTTYSRIFQGAEDGSGSFATNTTTQNQFIPASIDDWCFGGQVGSGCQTLDLSAYDGMSNILLKFENVNAYGNNTFLDNISLTSNCFIEVGAPTTDFLADISTGCEGTVIQFTDASYGNPNPTSWNWSFPGGTPSSSTAQNPSVTYNTEGVYNVTLTTSNGGASSNETLTNYVNINNNATHDFYVEGFENENSGWTVNNPDNGMTWERVETGGTQSGDFAYFLYHYEYETLGEIDQLVSPTLNFSNRANVSLELDYAYAKYDNNYTDEFKVYVSSNGGNSYNLVFSGSENGSGNFATREATTTNFVPSQASDWCYAGNFGAGCLSIDLSDYDDLSNIKIRLETVNGYSNNLYVDNVRLTSGCENFSANEELASITDWNIFPNPNTGQFILSMNNDKAANYRIQILDVLGQLVIEKEISTAGASSQTQFDLSRFPSGTYLVKLSDDVSSEVRKVVVQ